ncbi:MAG TPA: glycosyltransferase family 2 protein [Burkholderiales bacterium]
MTQSAKVVAVIPAYDEERTIRQIAAGARAHVADVIVVDDGSADGTSAALEGLPVTLLRNSSNQGKGGALWRGMQIALERGATAIVTLDADGQHRPQDIPRLVAAHRERPDVLVIGARLVAARAAPRLRRFANRFADFWISWAAGHWVPDSQSGFRLYPAELVRSLTVCHDRAHGFVFESEVVIEAARLGFRVLPVTVPAIYPTAARPSHFRPVADVARIVRMVAAYLITSGFCPAGLVAAMKERASILARDSSHVRS